MGIKCIYRRLITFRRQNLSNLRRTCSSKMHVKALTFYICALLLVNKVFAQNKAEKCITPNNEEGECVILSDCPQLQNELYEAGRSVRTNGKILQSFVCGDEDLKFCCPSNQPEYKYGDTLPDVRICGQHDDDKIMGGKLAGVGEFPWIALLEYKTRGGREYGCSGALINSRYVLTAAHCIKGNKLPFRWQLTSVRLGEYNTSSDRDCMPVPGGEYCSSKPLDVPVEYQIVHEDYNPYDYNEYHDIALLRLANPVPLTEFISPICLPKGDLLNRSFVGNEMKVAGWGRTEHNKYSDVLLKLDVQVQTNEYCKTIYRGRKVINEKQLCAGGISGEDSCTGDSGGPLMQSIKVGESKNLYALGIVSFGPRPCGFEGWPGVYTRITDYMPWIISKLKP